MPWLVAYPCSFAPTFGRGLPLFFYRPPWFLPIMPLQSQTAESALFRRLKTVAFNRFVSKIGFNLGQSGSPDETPLRTPSRAFLLARAECRLGGHHALREESVDSQPIGLDRDGHLVSKPGFTVPGRSIDAAGSGWAYHFTRYGSCEAPDWKPKTKFPHAPHPAQ
jgi:hypothetical protein